MQLPSTEPRYRLFVGVDIAAVTAAVSWMTPGTAPAFTIEQTPQGFAHLQNKLQTKEHAAASILVVMEAT